MKENGITVAWRFLTDTKAGRWQKFLLLLAFVYVVWPLDFLPDVAIVIGWIDDAVAMLLGLTTFMAALHRYRVERAAQQSVAPQHAAPLAPRPKDAIDTVGTEVS
jgi:uncharacterized membrane protein YkvA (DUF1232 family)